MSYKKILVDNTNCLRRFHIAFDDQEPKEEKVELKCFHCDAVVFSRKDHPAVKLLRDENLIQTTSFSSLRTEACDFKDTYSPASVPKE